MTRTRLIEIYEAELCHACDEAGDDFDLCKDLIDFTDDGRRGAWHRRARDPAAWLD